MTAVASATASPFASAALATTQLGALPWLSVAHPGGGRPQIVDPNGRTVLLRGVNLVGVEDDFFQGASLQTTASKWPIDPSAYDNRCPAMDHSAGEPPVCEVQAGLPKYEQSPAANSKNDLAQMRSLGFNVVRLPVSWSQLEPTPGSYSSLYLSRIGQVVGWAREQGIYVLLDMHQDDYSRYTPDTAPAQAPPLLSPTQQSPDHADGAPSWAVVTEGVPALAPLGVAQFNAFVEAAFTSFWLNRAPPGAPQGAAPGLGLQDHYIGAMAALAKAFRGNSAVIGYEIMNEPLPGFIPPGIFSATELYPFYARVIDALTGDTDAPGYRDLHVGVRRQAFFFEPMALRNLEDAPDQVPLPFSRYPNLVYAPHEYTHVFTVDREAGVPPASSPYPVSYDQALQVADLEARALNAALFVGEYGDSAGKDDVTVKGATAAQERALVGSTLWQWKGSCPAQPTPCTDIWAMYAADGSSPSAQNLVLLPTRLKFIARVYPLATAGQLLAESYDPDRHSFTMSAVATKRAPPNQSDQDTVVFIPYTITGGVTTTGDAVIEQVVTTPDGTRLAYVRPTSSGPYAVTVR